MPVLCTALESTKLFLGNQRQEEPGMDERSGQEAGPVCSHLAEVMPVICHLYRRFVRGKGHNRPNHPLKGHNPFSCIMVDWDCPAHNNHGLCVFYSSSSKETV